MASRFISVLWLIVQALQPWCIWSQALSTNELKGCTEQILLVGLYGLHLKETVDQQKERGMARDGIKPGLLDYALYQVSHQGAPKGIFKPF